MSLPYLHPYLGLSNGLNTLHAAGGGAGGIGGWVELGRTTLGGTSDNITVSSLSDKRYLMVLVDGQSSSGTRPNIRLNGDTGTNYSYRYSSNGGGDVTATSQAKAEVSNHAPSSIPQFNVIYMANYSSKEKLGISHNISQNTAGAGTAPSRTETVFKHAQTSNPVDEVTVYNDQAGDWASGAEVVVLGWDPADSHTNNFWEELLSETVGSDTNSHTFASFTAKKYLWIQLYYKYSGSGTPRPIFQFNGDAGNNYAERRSSNGGADDLATSASQIIAGNWDTTNTFSNFFIINNASNEKLGIQHWVNEETAGATTAPHRRENVFKWANTSNQITSITLKDSAGASSIDADCQIKVWGAN